MLMTSLGPSEEAASPPLITTLLRELCSKVCDKWEDIALFLHIEDGILRSFKRDYPSDSQKCFIEMLKHWLKQVDPPPTLAAIIDAIYTLGHESLALDLREKYLCIEGINTDYYCSVILKEHNYIMDWMTISNYN